MSRELLILEYFEGSPKVVPKRLLVAGPPGTLRLHSYKSLNHSCCHQPVSEEAYKSSKQKNWIIPEPQMSVLAGWDHWRGVALTVLSACILHPCPLALLMMLTHTKETVRGFLCRRMRVFLHSQQTQPMEPEEGAGLGTSSYPGPCGTTDSEWRVTPWGTTDRPDSLRML